MPAIDRQLLRRSWESWVSYETRNVEPYWLQLLWTFLFSAALAAVFAVLGYLFGGGQGRHTPSWFGFGNFYLRNLVVCLCIGYLTHAMFEALIRGIGPARIRAWPAWGRSAFFTGVPLTGVLIGWPLGITLVGGDLRVWINTPKGTHILIGSLLMACIITLLMHHWFATRTREIEARRRATEAQLRLLQGQVEPHFLFNTLAGVIGQIDESPQRAKAMLQAFTDYLRGSLGSLRHDQSTLQHELELAENFLRVMQARMEERLRFKIEAPGDAARIVLPPLLVQPLVENAVLHGLEPTLAGGEVGVRAWTEGERLRIQVRDNGQGVQAAAASNNGGNGVGLSNLRERMANRWGSHAQLSLTEAHPGTLAEIDLPLTRTST